MSDEAADTADAAENGDVYEVIQYKEDKRGRVNWCRIGRAHRKVGAPNISVKLYALPISNADGDVLFSLVPKK